MKAVEMTRQQLFDKVATHLLTQGKKAEKKVTLDDGVEDTVCQYRGEGGTRCSVGCLIEDADYTEALEGLNLYAREVQMVLGYVKEGDEELDPLKHTDLHLLLDLQDLHDTRSAEDWRRGLNDIATKHWLMFTY